MSLDRRKGSRRDLFTSGWTAKVESGQGVQRGILLDGSIQGVGLWVRKPPRVGSYVRLCIRARGGRLARASGEVRNTGMFRIGVKLLRSDGEFEESLTSLRQLSL